jgi:hypothetical protein
MTDDLDLVVVGGYDLRQLVEKGYRLRLEICLPQIEQQVAAHTDLDCLILGKHHIDFLKISLRNQFFT